MIRWCSSSAIHQLARLTPPPPASLQVLMRSDGNRLDENECRRLLRRVLSALTYLRILGVAHLDIRYDAHYHRLHYHDVAGLTH